MYKALLLVAVVAAAFARADCSSNTASSLGFLNTTGCSGAATCVSTLCTCLGGTYNSNSSMCAYGNAPTCASAKTCLVAASNCAISLIGGSLSGGCAASLAAVHSAFLTLQASSKAWNTSTPYGACTTFACAAINASGAASCGSDSDLATVCPSPFSTTLYITLGGNWTAILSSRVRSAAAKAALQLAIANDFLAATGYLPTVSLALAASTGNAIATLVVPAQTTIVTSFITQYGSSTTWLTSTKTAFTANGGTGTLTASATTTPITNAPSSSTNAPQSSSSGVGIATVAQVLVAALALMFLA